MGKTIEVVVADDNEDLCRNIQEYFDKRTDIKVTGVAYDGEEALELVQQQKPDLLILDIIMPRLDGISVLTRIKNKGLDTKIIVITAFGQEHVIQRVAELGAAYYLIKPFELSVLAKRIVELTSDKMASLISKKPVIDICSTVGNQLDSLGIPPNLKGYSYLKTAVSIVVGNWSHLYAVTKDLYPAVGKDHNASPAQVERAIRHAIEYAWLNGNPDTLNELFGNTVSIETGRPTNSVFIGRLAEFVKNHQVSLF